MRFSRTILPITALLAMSATTASAQILRGIGRKAADAIERKTEQKIDSEIEKAAERLVERSFESMFGGEDTTGSKNSKGSSRSSRMFNLMPNAPTEDRYDFDAVFTYEIENYEGGKSNGDKALMMMHFNSAGKYAGTRFLAADKKKEDGELFVIFDVKNQSMVMLMESEKDGKMSMAYSWKDALKYADTTTPPPAAARPSGRQTPPAAATTPTATYSKLGSKNIAGYATEGYRYDTPDGTMDVWIANDPSLTYGRMMGAASSMKQVRGNIPQDHPVGMLMETVTVDKKSGDKGRMTVTKIQKNANVKVDMAQYPRLGKATSK
jgi:hypothetical protein